MRIFLTLIFVFFCASLAAPSLAADSVRWDVYQFKVEHNNPRKINLLDGPTDTKKDKIVEDYLKDLALHLQAKGFSPPILPLTKDGKKYIIHLSKLDPDSLGSTSFSFSDNSVKSINMLLNTTHIYGDDPTELSPTGYVALGHELFHAVQNGYQLFKNKERKTSLGTWITEGIPDAFGHDMAFRFAPKSVMKKVDPKFKFFIPKRRWGGRKYAAALRVKSHYGVKEKHYRYFEANTAYRTSSLWRYIDEYVSANSQTVTGPPQHKPDYGYLADFFANDIPSGGSLEERELKWLDDRLNEHPKINQPLSVIYSKLVTTLAHYIPDRTKGMDNLYKGYNSKRESELWIWSLFDECKKATLSGEQTSTSVKLIFAKVSASCVEVTIKAPKNSSAKTIRTSADINFGVISQATTGKSDAQNSLQWIGWKGTNNSIKMIHSRNGKGTSGQNYAARQFNSWTLTNVPFDKPTIFVISNIANTIADTANKVDITMEISLAKNTGSWTQN